MHRRAALQGQEQVEQRVGVLAAREAHHDPIARGNHAEVGDRLADGAAQARRQALEGAGGLCVGALHVGSGGQADPSAGRAATSGAQPQAAATLVALSRYFAST